MGVGITIIYVQLYIMTSLIPTFSEKRESLGGEITCSQLCNQFVQQGIEPYNKTSKGVICSDFAYQIKHKQRTESSKLDA